MSQKVDAISLRAEPHLVFGVALTNACPLWANHDMTHAHDIGCMPQNCCQGRLAIISHTAFLYRFQTIQLD